MSTGNSGMSGGAFYGGRRATWAQIGGALAVASNCIGWLIFCLMCLGYGAAGMLSPLVLVLAIVGLVLAVAGPIFQKHAGDVDTHVLAALFISVFGIVGGLLELGVWRHWKVVWFSGAW